MAVTRLPSTRLKKLNEVILALYEEDGPEGLIEHAVELIQTLVPHTWLSVDEILVPSNQARHHAGRNLAALPDLEALMTRYGRENPNVSYVQDVEFRPALKISDFTSLPRFRKTGYYSEVARQMTGWRDQVALITRLPGSFLGFAVNRDRAFSAEDLLVLELLQPHLERLLRRGRQFADLAASSPLTPREREVLHWVAEGKRDGEIAVILRLSVRTVEQHVRACLQKLGVETRSTAVAAVWRGRAAMGR